MILIRCFISLVLLVCTACSSFLSNNSKTANSLKQKLSKDKVNPYNLEIVDDLYDGQDLFLKIKIEHLIDNKEFPTYLVIQGLLTGDLMLERYFDLNDLTIAESDSFVVSIPAIGLTDYQVHLMWGDEAKMFYNKIYPDIIEKVELREVAVDKVKECREEDCTVKYKLGILVVNNAEITVPELNLNVSLLEDFDDIDVIPVFQQKIPVKSLNLRPSAERNLQYVLVEPPELEDMQLKVNVDIILLE